MVLLWFTQFQPGKKNNQISREILKVYYSWSWRRHYIHWSFCGRGCIGCVVYAWILFHPQSCKHMTRLSRDSCAPVTLWASRVLVSHWNKPSCCAGKLFLGKSFRPEIVPPELVWRKFSAKFRVKFHNWHQSSCFIKRKVTWNSKVFWEICKISKTLVICSLSKFSGIVNFN